MLTELAFSATKGAALEAGRLAVQDPEKLRERARQIDNYVVENIRPPQERESTTGYRGGNRLTGPLTWASVGAMAAGSTPVAVGLAASASAVEVRTLCHDRGWCVIL